MVLFQKLLYLDSLVAENFDFSLICIESCMFPTSSSV